MPTWRARLSCCLFGYTTPAEQGVMPLAVLVEPSAPSFVRGEPHEEDPLISYSLYDGTEEPGEPGEPHEEDPLIPHSLYDGTGAF